MARRTRSILLVLLGTGVAVPGCDERRDRLGTPVPDGTDGPTTRPIYPDDGGGSAPPYGYGPAVHSARPGIGWIGGTAFDARRRYGWGGGYPWAGGYASARSYAPGRTNGGSPSFDHSSSSSEAATSSHGTTFGGFGEHASATHAGS